MLRINNLEYSMGLFTKMFAEIEQRTGVGEYEAKGYAATAVCAVATALSAYFNQGGLAVVGAASTLTTGLLTNELRSRRVQTGSYEPVPVDVRADTREP